MMNHGSFKSVAQLRALAGYWRQEADNAINPNHGGDIVVWTSSSGAYAGLTFNGPVIKTDSEENAVPATGPEAESLRHNLSTVF